MSGTRKIRQNSNDDVRITIIIDCELNDRLRALAHQQGTKIAPLLREWIMDRLPVEETKTAPI